LIFKKIACVFISICLLTGFAGIGAYASDGDIFVVVDGRELADCGSYISSGRVMAPVALFAETLGAEYKWDPAAREVTVYYAGLYVWMQLGNSSMYRGGYAVGENGEYALLSVVSIEGSNAPEITGGRMYAPLGLFVEALGGHAYWDSAARTAYVSTPSDAESGHPRLARRDPAESMARQLSNHAQAGILAPLDASEAQKKYEADEPFLLFLYDGSAYDRALLDSIRAAADLSLRVYGLDTSRSLNAKPNFVREKDLSGEPRLYMISGLGSVEILEQLSYRNAREAMLYYFG